MVSENSEAGIDRPDAAADDANVEGRRRDRQDRRRRGESGQRGGDRDRRQRRGHDYDSRSDQEFFEKVVDVRRVSKVVKGGRNLTFTALVVVGNGRGKVGMSIGRGTSVPDAVRKGSMQARKDENMRTIVRKGNTVPHDVVAKYDGAQVFLKPAPPGAGIIAGGGVRATLEAAGISDIFSKSLNSNNPINVVRATIKALEMMSDPVAARSRRRLPAQATETAVAAPDDASGVAETSEVDAVTEQG